MKLNNNDIRYLDYYKKEFVLKCEKCAGEDAFCDCWRAYNREISKAVAKIPEHLRKYKFSSIKHPDTKNKSKNKLINYAYNLEHMRYGGDKNCWYFSGSKGTGKSLVMALLLMTAIKQGYKVYYFSSLRACADLLKREWSLKDEFNEASFTKIMSEYDFVAVDNLNRVDTDWTDNMKRIIEEGFALRAEECLPTFFGACKKRCELAPDSIEFKVVSGFSPMFKDNLNFEGFDYGKEVLTRV